MKTEKEKMISGENYFPETEELIKERTEAKKLCLEYNNLPYENKERKNAILEKLFGKCDENITVEPNFFCDYGYNIFAGKNFYVNHNCVILDCAKITFGDNVFIGPNCGFYTANHPINTEERNKGIENAKPINIGNNVWIGGNVTVLSGVNIGDNVVIGAGSTVVGDIPSNSVAVGNPCKAIRTLL